MLAIHCRWLELHWRKREVKLQCCCFEPNGNSTKGLCTHTHTHTHTHICDYNQTATQPTDYSTVAVSPLRQ
jgi:hypothetical protein